MIALVLFLWEEKTIVKRTINKQFWLSEEENRILRENAEKTGLPESVLLRALIQGYLPKEKPDDRFYDICATLYCISGDLRKIKTRAERLGLLDSEKLNEEIKRLDEFQSRLETEYLSPETARNLPSSG